MSYKIKISILIITFLLLVLALIFFLENFISEIKKTSSEIFSKRSEMLLLEEKVQKSEEFSEFFKREEKNFEKVNSSFINPEMPVDFISFLEKAAKDSNLFFQLSTVSLTKEKTSWPAVNFQINLAGFYPDVFKFLRELYYSSYLIEIKSLEISKTEKEALGNAKVNLLIKVFAQEK